MMADKSEFNFLQKFGSRKGKNLENRSSKFRNNSVAGLGAQPAL